MVKRATKAEPLPRVRILVVRDHPEGTINHRVADATNPGLDQLDLVADLGKDGMEGKGRTTAILYHRWAMLLVCTKRNLNHRWTNCSQTGKSSDITTRLPL